VRAGHVLLTAEVHPESADAVLELLVRSGVPEEDIALARLDEIALVGPGRAATSLIWADLLGQARRNARAVARYLVFMMAAGVIAAYGVIEANGILIVGAMAVSPDLLPITAACVGLVSRRGRLVRHALVTLGAWVTTGFPTDFRLFRRSDQKGRRLRGREKPTQRLLVENRYY
jgi:hypothetical protein